MGALNPAPLPRWRHKNGGERVTAQQFLSLLQRGMAVFSNQPFVFFAEGEAKHPIQSFSLMICNESVLLSKFTDSWSWQRTPFKSYIYFLHTIFFNSLRESPQFFSAAGVCHQAALDRVCCFASDCVHRVRK